MNSIYIFGAHSRARTLKEYLKKVKPELKALAYLVDNEETNPETEDGIPVIHLSDRDAIAGLDKAATVYLGVKKVNQAGAARHLREIGFKDLIPLTVELDTSLRNEYLRQDFQERGEQFQKLNDFPDVKDDEGQKNAEGQKDEFKDEQKGKQKTRLKDEQKAELKDRQDHVNKEETVSCGGRMRIYVASSIYDGELQEKHEFLPFEKVIQVGCALTEKRLEGAIYDDKGDSISGRNQQFCELTALYWIWKNAMEEYVGLEHYRRFFVLPDHLTERMAAHGIDVILPVPLYVAPSVEENYRFRHVPKVWDDMLDCLKENGEGEIEAACRFFGRGLYSPCNMLIAKKDVFDRMCAWMFPILFTVTEKNGTFADRYQNRYPGFLSERLMSLYFEMHKTDLKMVYADKVFLQ